MIGGELEVTSTQVLVEFPHTKYVDSASFSTWLLFISVEVRVLEAKAIIGSSVPSGAH